MSYLIQRLFLIKLTKPHQLHPYTCSTHTDIHHLRHLHIQQTVRQLCTHQLPSNCISNLKVPHSLFLLPILPGSILLVITDPHQHQPLDWIPIQLITNHFKLHPCSYTSTTVDHIPEAKTLEVVQQFLKEPMLTSQ